MFIYHLQQQTLEPENNPFVQSPSHLQLVIVYKVHRTSDLYEQI